MRWGRRRLPVYRQVCVVGTLLFEAAHCVLVLSKNLDFIKGKTLHHHDFKWIKPFLSVNILKCPYFISALHTPHQDHSRPTRRSGSLTYIYPTQATAKRLCSPPPVPTLIRFQHHTYYTIHKNTQCASSPSSHYSPFSPREPSSKRSIVVKRPGRSMDSMMLFMSLSIRLGEFIYSDVCVFNFLWYEDFVCSFEMWEGTGVYFMALYYYLWWLIVWIG